MRTTRFFSFLVFAVALVCALPTWSNARAQKTTTPENVQTLYIYGVSQNLNDTIAYVSDITAITGKALLQKGYFMQRDQYADQFKTFVQRRYARPHQTCAIFFDTDIQSAEKTREKLRKHLAGSPGVLGKIAIKDVYKDEFAFKPID